MLSWQQLKYLIVAAPAVALYGSGAYELGFAFYVLLTLALAATALVRRHWAGLRHLKLRAGRSSTPLIARPRA